MASSFTSSIQESGLISEKRAEPPPSSTSAKESWGSGNPKREFWNVCFRSEADDSQRAGLPTLPPRLKALTFNLRGFFVSLFFYGLYIRRLLLETVTLISDEILRFFFFSLVAELTMFTFNVFINLWVRWRWNYSLLLLTLCSIFIVSPLVVSLSILLLRLPYLQFWEYFLIFLK